MDQAAVLREEYLALRAEITQSIAKQHEITLGGYAFTGAALGYILSSQTIDFRALAIVPMVLLAMVSLWAVECNRMVRASYYIGYVLWPQLCEACGVTGFEGWEAWIRTGAGPERGFRVRQHWFQQVAVFFLPAALSVAVMALMLARSWENEFWCWGIACYGLFLVVVWTVMYKSLRKVSDLAAVIRPK